MTLDAALAAIARLGAFWPHVPDSTLRGYAAELAGLRWAEPADLEAASHALVAQHDYFPSFSAVIEAVRVEAATRQRLRELPAAGGSRADQTAAGPPVPREELARRFRRLREALSQGLGGEELRAATLEPEVCDEDVSR